MRIPERLRWIEALDDGAAWLAAVPRTLGELADSWQLDLELDNPYPDSFVSWVAPARRLGEPVVLKLQYPHDEIAHEAHALTAWDGDGAVRLLAHDAGRHALLLERCEPGHHLSTIDPNDALDILAGLLPRLWIPVSDPFKPLADEASIWIDHLPARWERNGGPFPKRLMEAAVEALTHVAHTHRESFLLHQDLHAENVVAARREPWLVIDPKPLRGERAFGLAPIIRSSELGHSRADVVGRLDRLTDNLGIDRERARLWTLGQTVAWSFNEREVHQAHVETAHWLLDA